MRTSLSNLLLCLLLGIGIGVQRAAAQFSTNYQTNIVSSTTVSSTNAYYVGSNTYANSLLIRNAGVLSNADSYIGYLPASSNNLVMVSGASSAWSNANMNLGCSGAANNLIISNAGHVYNSLFTLVSTAPSSPNNRILVTGSNSVLDSPSGLYLGVSGSSNSLIITNGGRVNDSTCLFAENVTSSGNSVLVTGVGSLWSNSAAFTLGFIGSNNKLTINQGAHVISANSTIGQFDTASNNTLVVSDNGSLWDDSAVASEITFGSLSSGNSLIVTNGGKVLGYYAYFGRQNSGYNSALISGAGSSFSVNCYIYTGFQGHDNTFTAANGATISDKFCYISHEIGSSNNSVLVTGPNTSWQNSYSVFVGFSGCNSGLTVSNGATLNVTEDGVLSYDINTSNNRALVTGTGSLWNCLQSMYVGWDGPGNTLTISNGGKVADDYGILGTDDNSVSNLVLVTGSGSFWTNKSDVYVGFSSGENSLVVSNGGRLQNYAGLIGHETNSSNNAVIITGAGSTWTNAGALMVGYYGSSNSLVISNGGKVVDYWGMIGEQDSSSDNAVYVQSGGIWQNKIIAVGDIGSHNALFVDGGTVSATNMIIGNGSLYCNNLVELNSGEIDITNAAGTAQLEVYYGSLVIFGGTLRVDTLIVTNDCAQFMQVGGTLIYKKLILNADGDADGDGIPNGWEQAHGLDPFNPFDADSDNDGDKMSNRLEFMAGTDPNSAASNLHITSQVMAGKDVRVSWMAVGGKSYVLQVSDKPTAGYTDLSPVITIPGTGETSTNYLHVGAITNWPVRYYRVRLAP